MGAPHFARARIGTVLSGKWRLDELLGWGGMASVYAGTHVRNRSRVAVKVLHPEITSESVLRTRFLREGYVANSIKHPGIVRVFDDSAEDESAYLVMELLSGKTLKEAWRKSDRAMPLEEIGRVISAILEVLSVAHKAGIVHRDIKPDNVFLTDEGAVKVLDFGIASVQELRAAGEHVTTTGTTLGTPAFMPPEQAHGKWALVDHRADIFSVGATARLLLTGRLPHEATGSTELLIAAATKRVQPTRSVAPNVPASIAAVVDRALGFEREERYPSADEMKAEWDRALSAAIASGTKSIPPTADASTTQPSWGSGADAEARASVPNPQSDAVATVVGKEPSLGAQAPIVSAIEAPMSTHGALAKDTRSRGLSGRGIVSFAVVGVVAVAVVVIGVFALRGNDPSTAASTSTATSDTTNARTSESPPAAAVSNAAASSSAAASPTATTAPSSTASARTTKITPPPPVRPPPPAQASCPPVFYGRDMNDQPEYRCCGKPCR